MDSYSMPTGKVIDRTVNSAFLLHTGTVPTMHPILVLRHFFIFKLLISFYILCKHTNNEVSGTVI